MKNIILIAPPAAGKGTQSKLISETYNIPHISTGDLLREEVASGSMLGKSLKSDMDHGNLISDDIIINLLRSRILKADCNNGFILDGFPRTTLQADVYDNMIRELSYDDCTVIFMDIDRDLALKRTISRLICSSCGESYNTSVEALMPRISGICNKCGHALTKRSDDNIETASVRYDTYLKNTQPLIDYYKNKGILKELKIIESDTYLDVFDKIKKLINE